MRRGDAVTIVREGIVHAARARKMGAEIRVAYTEEVRGHDDGAWSATNIRGFREKSFHVRRNQEGITWARGWFGPEVDALRTSLALR